jgi:hypothetical protein
MRPKKIKVIVVATALATGLAGGGFAIGRASQKTAMPAGLQGK